MAYLPNLIFIIILAVAVFFFMKSVGTIRRNIFLGRDEDRSDNKKERWKTMALVALGQSKMTRRPVAGIMHILVYVGFVLINIEVLEIIIDGIVAGGPIRVFQPFLGGVYSIAIGFFEILAVLVIVACAVFLVRRNILKVKRFDGKEMTSWPKWDANLILIIEITLMTALLLLNAVDHKLQASSSLPISSWLAPIFHGMSESSLHIIETVAWWAHIIGILLFLNYVPFSKHFHIFLAFPNTYYSNLNEKGEFENMQSVTNEVKLMMDPSTPMPEPGDPETFGAKDVTDLTWKNLMDSYSCTECGRCTSVCPANLTGKVLSPRKVMMDTRDRLEEVGKNIDKHGKDYSDEKDLHSYISEEELWACTTCNACVDICPVNINPMEIIYKMRQYLVMEKSSAPNELNLTFTNMENNGAPWQFSPMDRANWIEED